MSSEVIIYSVRRMHANSDDQFLLCIGVTSLKGCVFATSTVPVLGREDAMRARLSGNALEAGGAGQSRALPLISSAPATRVIVNC